MKLITMRRGGAGGQVAINVDLVTQIRSTTGPFTDIYFAGEFVTVEGQFAQVAARIAAAARPEPAAVTKMYSMETPGRTPPATRAAS
ncbi:MAG TPA: hypothetical protein VF577_07640 [Allosphingosinicella sp.]